MEAKLTRSGDEFVIRIPAEDAEKAGWGDGETVAIYRSQSTPTYAEMIAEMDRLGPSHRPPTVDWGPDVGTEIIRDEWA